MENSIIINNNEKNESYDENNGDESVQANPGKRKISLIDLVTFVPCGASNHEALIPNNNNNDSSPQQCAVVRRKDKKPQCFAVFVVTIGSFGLGTVLGWPAPALDELRQTRAFGGLGTTQSSWIASLALLGALFSCLISSIFINRFGRRRTMFLIILPFLLGWALIGFATSYAMIYVGRFITGFAGGTFPLAVPIYISEVTEDSMRGRLGSCMILMLVNGMLFSFVFGTLFTWNVLSLICGIFPLLLLVGLMFIPESPRFYLLKGNVAGARKSLLWLHGGSTGKATAEAVEQELSLLKFSIESEKRTAALSKTAIWTLPIMKPTLICMLLMFFQQFGGINGIISYTVEIFRLVGPSINANVSSIILASVQVIVVLTSLVLVDKVGRKVLLIGSAVIMALSLITLGGFFYIKNVIRDEELTSSLSWIPLVSLAAYIVVFSGGMGPLPWLLTMELLNPAEKGTTTSAVTMTYWLSAFVSTKIFEDIASLESIGWHGCYWAFASITIVGIVFMYFVIPETKGKTSQEIQAYFSSRPTPGGGGGQAKIQSRKLSGAVGAGYEEFPLNQELDELEKV